MTYFLWSRGRLLGSSELEFVRCIPLHRMGTIQPADGAAHLLETASGTSPALHELMRRRGRPDAAGRDKQTLDLMNEAVRASTEYADFSAALHYESSLALELRRQDGSLVPTVWVAVTDTHHLLRLAHEIETEEDDDTPIDPKLQADIDHDLELLEEMRHREPWQPDEEEYSEADWFVESKYPRYHVQVELSNEWDVP
jgi:hypothetical protein